LGAQFGSSGNLAAAAGIAGSSADISASANVNEETEQVAKKMRTEDGSSATGSSSLVTQALAQQSAVKGRGKRTTTDAGESTTVSSATAEDDVELVVNRPMAGTMMLPVAIKMNIVGTLIIHINANNKIHRFEYIQKVIKMS
jgi:hypothetical protein